MLRLATVSLQVAPAPGVGTAGQLRGVQAAPVMLQVPLVTMSGHWVVLGPGCPGLPSAPAQAVSVSTLHLPAKQEASVVQAAPLMLQTFPCGGHSLSAKQPALVMLQLPPSVGQLALTVHALPAIEQVPGTVGHCELLRHVLPVLLQTPVAFYGFQPYFTTGAGLYRETLETHQDTSVGYNTGGGVKVSLAGPLRLRVDYRVFKLGSGALYSPAHRIYAGLNLKL